MVGRGGGGVLGEEVLRSALLPGNSTARVMQGWVVKEVVRHRGKFVGRVDKYYRHRVCGVTVRSRRARDAHARACREATPATTPAKTTTAFESYEAGVGSVRSDSDDPFEHDDAITRAQLAAEVRAHATPLAYLRALGVTSEAQLDKYVEFLGVGDLIRAATRCH